MGEEAATFAERAAGNAEERHGDALKDPHYLTEHSVKLAKPLCCCDSHSIL